MALAVWQYAGREESDESEDEVGERPLYQPRLDYSARLTRAIENGASERTIVRLSAHPLCKDIRNANPETGYTNLMLAASLGRLDIFRALLERGHDSKESSRDIARNTCLHLCARLGEIPILQYYASFFPRLLDWTNSNGLTALAVACSYGQSLAVQMLLELGSDLNHPDHDGNTPLHYAASFGHEGIIKMLFRKGLALPYPAPRASDEDEDEDEGRHEAKTILTVSPPQTPNRLIADLVPTSTGHLQFAARNSRGFSAMDYAYNFQVAALIKRLGRELFSQHPEVESDLWGSAGAYELGKREGGSARGIERTPKTPNRGEAGSPGQRGRERESTASLSPGMRSDLAEASPTGTGIGEDASAVRGPAAMVGLGLDHPSGGGAEEGNGVGKGENESSDEDVIPLRRDEPGPAMAMEEPALEAEGTHSSGHASSRASRRPRRAETRTAETRTAETRTAEAEAYLGFGRGHGGGDGAGGRLEVGPGVEVEDAATRMPERKGRRRWFRLG